MRQWSERTIPRILQILYLGQAIASGFSRKLSSLWYDQALPKNSAHKFQFIECADKHYGLVAVFVEQVLCKV